MDFLQVEKYTYLTKEYETYMEQLKEYCKNTPRHPKFHIHPPCGLMNDPNGLAYFAGKYHVFYQWFPFGPEHGMKHWAHVTSEDLINWEWSEEMLVPEQEYEKNGCYSGNAFRQGNRLCLYYTANYKDGLRKIPKQAMAYMNEQGSICKCKHNPIIDEQPEGLIGEIRDPFVFEKDGRHLMFLGGGSVEGEAKLLLYESTDLEHWDYQGVVDVCANGLYMGYMFECPSYIEVGGKDVLMLSLMGREPEGERYHNEFSSLYFIGKLDLERMRFDVENYDEIDKGFDFYAPQVFYGKENRPMMFAWLGCGVQDLPYAKEDMWIHSLTMPRILTIEDGKLFQRVPEVISEKYQEIKPAGNVAETEEHTWKMHLETNVRPWKKLQIGEDGDCFMIEADTETGYISVDRSRLQEKICEQFGNVRSVHLKNKPISEIDLYYDNTFVELYVNGGEEIMTFRAYPEKMQIRIS